MGQGQARAQGIWLHDGSSHCTKKLEFQRITFGKSVELGTLGVVDLFDPRARKRREKGRQGKCRHCPAMLLDVLWWE